MPRPRKTDRVYLPHNVVPPDILCAWCKTTFQLTKTQMRRVLAGGIACCSAKCSGRYHAWKRDRQRAA